MLVKDSKMTYLDKPNHRSLDLAAVGVPDVPVLYFIRHGHRLLPVETHFHKGCYEFGLCLRGDITLENRGVQYPVRAGDLFVNHPEAPHRLMDYPKGAVLYGLLLNTSGPNARFLRFTKAECNEICARLSNLPPTLAVDTSLFRQMFAELFHIYDNMRGKHRTLSLTSACMYLIATLLDTPPRKELPALSERLMAVVEEIRRNPEKSFDIDTLAQKAFSSPSHLIVQFKRITGLPPRQFQLKCRIERSKQLLRQSQMSIAEIALQLGFCSQQHFAGFFKRITGATPHAWRKSQDQ